MLSNSHSSLFFVSRGIQFHDGTPGNVAHHVPYAGVDLVARADLLTQLLHLLLLHLGLHMLAAQLLLRLPKLLLRPIPPQPRRVSAARNPKLSKRVR